MRAIGDRLRAERENQKIPLTRVAEDLRISQRYLEAIEKGDQESLPGGFFYRAFVRQYARYLKLNEDHFDVVLEELRGEPQQDSPDAAREEKFPLDVPPLNETGRRNEGVGKLLWSLVGLIGVLAVGAIVYSVLGTMRSGEPVVTQAEQQKQAAPAQAPAPVQQQQPQQQQQAQAPAPQEQPQQQQREYIQPPAQAPAQTPAQPPAAVLPADAQGPRFSVALVATEDVWISYATAGKVLAVGVMKAGEARQFEGAGAAKLVVGNAGGIDVKINGRSAGPVGPRGQPRTLVLTPEGAQVAPPKPKPEQPQQPPVT